MRFPVLLVAAALAGAVWLVACGGDPLSGFSNGLGGGGPSSVTIVIGDSQAIPGFRPAFDTVVTQDTIQFSVDPGAADTAYNVTWLSSPPGVPLPVNSGDLMAGQAYDVNLPQQGYYSYHCTHHKNMSGTFYVLVGENNQRVPFCASGRCRP